jgi:YD repeat-containing protein
VTKIHGVLTEARTFHYGNENRLEKITAADGTAIADYRHDSAGNRIQKVTPAGTTYYTFDERNLMVSCQDGNQLVAMAYDGEGRRVAQTTNGAKRELVIDPSRRFYETIEERDASGNVVGTVMYGVERLMRLDAAGAATFYLADRLGSVRLLTDQAGQITESFDFDAFGTLRTPQP